MHKPEKNQELATFGAGCYWGTEKFFATTFAEKYPGAILGTAVGFMNPDPNAPPDPSYERVCMTGTTGYVDEFMQTERTDFDYNRWYTTSFSAVGSTLECKLYDDHGDIILSV